MEGAWAVFRGGTKDALQELSLVILRKLCQEKQLPVSGTKAALAERLEGYVRISLVIHKKISS